MFHCNLKQLRMSHGYSMDQLCSLYNKKYNGKMNKSTLSRYENGLQEPMFSAVKNLAEFFNISVEELIQSDFSVKDKRKVFAEEKTVHLILTNKEAELLSCFHMLSDSGKEKAIEKLHTLQQTEQREAKQNERMESSRFEQAAGWNRLK